eukprot:1148543-Pelagomonas_calceolata.AAC.5
MMSSSGYCNVEHCGHCKLEWCMVQTSLAIAANIAPFHFPAGAGSRPGVGQPRGGRGLWLEEDGAAHPAAIPGAGTDELGTSLEAPEKQNYGGGAKHCWTRVPLLARSVRVLAQYKRVLSPRIIYPQMIGVWPRSSHCCHEEVCKDVSNCKECG